jgi:ribosome biogenesis GTPase
MRQSLQDCKYHNCMHINEPGCRIKELVESGDIHMERYLNYLSIIRNEDIFE